MSEFKRDDTAIQESIVSLVCFFKSVREKSRSDIVDQSDIGFLAGVNSE